MCSLVLFSTAKPCAQNELKFDLRHYLTEFTQHACSDGVTIFTSQLAPICFKFVFRGFWITAARMRECRVQTQSDSCAE